MWVTVCLVASLVPIAIADVRCIRAGGNCRLTSQGCSGSFRRGMCNGPANRQCCMPGGGSGDAACIAAGGSCRLTSQGCPGGSFTSGMCGGPANRQCCRRGTRPPDRTCAGVSIVSRAGWGARPPKRRSTMRTPVNMLFIHHTVTRQCTSRAVCSAEVRRIQNMHMGGRRNWNDIAYNWLIGEDGLVYEGRGWTATGGHTRGYNSVSTAVSVLGNYMTRVPNAAAMRAIRGIIACGVQGNYVTSNHELRGHRDAGCTACPGNLLYAEIQKWPRYSRRPIRKVCGG